MFFSLVDSRNVIEHDCCSTYIECLTFHRVNYKNMFFQEAPTGNSTLFRTLAQETGLLESTQLEVEDGHLRLHLSESTIHTHSVVGEGNLCNVPSKNLDETRYFSTMG